MAQPPEVNEPHFYYKSFEDFKARVRMLKLTAEWQIIEKEGWIRVFNEDNKHILPPFEIYIDQSLSFFIRVFGWRISDDHSVFFISVSRNHFPPDSVRRIICVLCLWLMKVK